MNTLDLARSYLAKLPAAISGAGGHPATFRAACECVRFGLSDGDALTLLREWNGTHCNPPWTEKELAHKLRDARAKAAAQVRTFAQPRPAVRVVWKLERKAVRVTTAATALPINAPKPGRVAAPEPEAEPPLPADCAPWLYIAKQVIQGEFDGADRSTSESLVFGLRSIPHPLCRKAHKLLKATKGAGR